MQARCPMKSASSANKMAQRFLTLIIIGVITLLTAATVFGQSRDDSGNKDRPEINDPVPQWVPGQLVVKLSDGAELSDIMSSMFNYNLVESLDHTGVYLFTADKGYTPSLTLQSLSSMAGVEWVEPNYLINRLHAVQGSYPFSDVQKVGSMDNQPAVDLLNLNQTHTVATGQGVTVGVIDGGIDINHPALDGRAEYGWDYSGNDAVADDEPGGVVSGHGTFVAGLIHLTAPDARLRAYRVISADGYGDGFTLARAIERAVDEGCQVINISLVLYHQHLAVTEAIQYAHSMGVTVVTAAGNDGSDTPIYPAADDYTIGVAAVGDNMGLESYSNFGSFVDVCAPAHRAYSAYLDDGYAWWSGTSFATPFVSGQAALLLQHAPLATPDEIETGMKESAADLTPANPDHAGELGSGFVSPLTSLSALGESGGLLFDTLYFDHFEGAMYIVLPSQYNIITSTNAPAAYTAELLGSVPFGVYFDTVGMTTDNTLDGDTTWILLDPWLTPEGTYYATIRYTIDGVNYPVDLTIALTVHPTQGGQDYVLLSPPGIYFQAELGSNVIQHGGAVLTSTNAPANYTAQLLDTGSFTTLLDLSGQTPDTVDVEVDPSVITSPGFYVDTVLYYVEGIQTPAVMFVNLTVFDPNQSTDTGSVWPKVRSYTSPTGVLTEGSSAFVVSSGAGNHPYTVSISGSNDFVTLTNNNGTTNVDQITFSYTTPDTQTPRFYADTLIINVDGIVNSPLKAIVTLNVYEDSTGSGTASAWPYSQFFEVAKNTPFDIDGTVFLNFTNGQSNYTATLANQSSWLTLDQPSGLTGDSILFSISDSTGLDSGIYIDTILFNVEQATNNPIHAIVYLAVGGAGSGNGTVTVSPLASAYYHNANQPFNESSTVYISATKQPYNFTVSVVGTNDFTDLITSSGTTDQNVNFNVASASGLAPGVYADTLRFDVPGTANTPRFAFLYLQISDTASTGACCESVGDVNGNGIKPELADTVTLSALLSGDTSLVYLIPCLGNADMNQDCQIDHTDMDLLKQFIAGDTLNFQGCGSCSEYTVVFDTGNGGGTNRITLAPNFQTFNVASNSAFSLQGGIVVSYDGTPTTWTASILDDPDFLSLNQSSGNTNDTAQFTVSNVTGLPQGLYADTILFYVSGAQNSPDIGVVYLQVGDSTSGGGSDSAWVSPTTLTFNVPYQSLGMYADVLHVFSSNAPANYIAWVLDAYFDPFSFVGIPDSVGTTNDSTVIGVSVDGLAIGTYVDTVVIDVNGTEASAICIVTLNVGADSSSRHNEDELSLSNHPNPFNPTTSISFNLPEASNVELTVFNVLGQEVRALMNGFVAAGEHQVEWNGTDDQGQRVASGIYLYRLKAAEISITKKMLLIK